MGSHSVGPGENMSVLDLAVCPICQAKDSLARQTATVEGRSHITYECLECGSVVAWLGDDLWLEADRWAFQEIGREEMAYLLHRSMTAAELQELANREPPPSSQPTRIPFAWPGRQREVETAASTAAPDMLIAAEGVEEVEEVPAEKSWEAVLPEVIGATKAPAKPAGQLPAIQRRSRGSPFLAASVAMILVCLVFAAAAMIAFPSLTGRATPEAAPSATAKSEALPTEVLSPTDTPAATDTPPPTPAEESDVLFQGVTDYVSATGSHYVVGEVVNTTEENLRFVEVLASFYDATGQLVGTGSTFTELSIIEAGGSAPFKLATLDPSPSLASYKLRTDYLTTSQALLRVEVVSHSEYVADNGWYHIVGEIRNPNGFRVKFPKLVATYYNATHEVMRVEMAFSELETLDTGQTSTFEVVLVDPPGDLHHYSLAAEAVPE
jgi:hypothetical protein